MKRMSAEELLGLDKFQEDKERAHITVNKEICGHCPGKPCVYACPAGLYKVEGGQTSFDYLGCLECGTCRVACPNAKQAITWSYPRGGFGVQFRFG